MFYFFLLFHLFFLPYWLFFVCFDFGSSGYFLVLLLFLGFPFLVLARKQESERVASKRKNENKERVKERDRHTKREQGSIKNNFRQE